MSKKGHHNEDTEKYGLYRMTKEAIVKLCKKNGLYTTPRLNDVLYLHYQGYQAIEHLEEYTGVKCLWLENNAISEISGLDNQKELRCLFLHNNLIKKMENLENCSRLDTINLSHNFIFTIENCGSNILGELNTLNLSHNKLHTAGDISMLSACLTLSVLDLSHNRIDDLLIVGVLAQMPELRVLVLTGNPVVSLIPSYRKTMINECKQLTYLDSRPVFEKDRACAEAWKRGGYEEERREHARWLKAERRKVRDSVNATLALRRKYAGAGDGKHAVELLVSSSDEDGCELNSVQKKQDTKFRQCSKCNSTECKYVDLCDENRSVSPKPSDDESNMLNIFDEVAGDISIQGQMYEFDAKDADCVEWNDLPDNRNIYDNIVIAKQDTTIDIIPDLDNNQRNVPGAGEITRSNHVDMPPNEMIEFNSQNPGNSIMFQLHNIVGNSAETKQTDSVQIEKTPGSFHCSDSAIHIKRRLIIEEISVKKYNENNEAVGTAESLCKQVVIPPLESLEFSEPELPEISSKDLVNSAEIQSKLEHIPETVFKHDTQITTTFDEISSNELTNENSSCMLGEIPLSEYTSVEFNITDAAHTVGQTVDDYETNSSDISTTLDQSISNSSDIVANFVAHVYAVPEDYPDSPKSIPVALKYQELKTRDHNIEDHIKTTFSGSSIDEIFTSDDSESDENDPQMTASESPDTMEKFLSKYNIFLENMGTRLNHLRDMTDQLRESRAQIDEEFTQLGISRPTTTESIDEEEEDAEQTLYSDAENVECIDHTNRSDLVDRLLVSKSPLFDLSAEDVNRQVDALRDNNFKSTAEMIDRVYCQRDRYDLEVEHDEDHSIKDYYKAFGDFIDDDKDQLDANFNMEEVADLEQPEALHYLLDFEEAQIKERENGGRLTIYCENVDKLVVEDSRFTPDFVNDGNIRGVKAEEDVPEELFESTEGYGEISIDRFVGIENRDSILEIIYQTDSIPNDIITTGATHPELEINGGLKDTGTQPRDPNAENKKYIENADKSLFSNFHTYNLSDSVQDTFPGVSLQIRTVRKEASVNAACLKSGAIHTDMAFESDCGQSKLYQNLPSTINENAESLGFREPFDSPEPNSNITNSDPSIDEICSIEYIKNLIVKGPTLSDIAASDIYGQLNITSNEELETEGSAEYDKYIANLEALDQQLYTNIEQALTTASLEFKVRNSLIDMDDPTGDDLTDVNIRAERYTAEFMERFAKYKSQQGGSGSDV